MRSNWNRDFIWRSFCGRKAFILRLISVQWFRSGGLNELSGGIRNMVLVVRVIWRRKFLLVLGNQDIDQVRVENVRLSLGKIFIRFWEVPSILLRPIQQASRETHFSKTEAKTILKTHQSPVIWPQSISSYCSINVMAQFNVPYSHMVYDFISS